MWRLPRFGRRRTRQRTRATFLNIAPWFRWRSQTNYKPIVANPNSSRITFPQYYKISFVVLKLPTSVKHFAIAKSRIMKKKECASLKIM
jgi:hypothetical protein